MRTLLADKEREEEAALVRFLWARLMSSFPNFREAKAKKED